MGRFFALFLVLIVIVGFSFAPAYSEKVDWVLVSSEGVVERAGVLVDVGFPQGLPVAWFPTFLDVDSCELFYPMGVNWTLVDAVKSEMEGQHGSKLALIIAPLGLSVDDRALDDPAIVITVERAQEYYLERGYNVFVALGKDASLEVLIAFILVSEELAIDYAIYGVSHGVLEGDLHGVVLFSSLSGPTVVNSFILREFTGLKNARGINEFTWVACSIEDEYDLFGESAFVSFFSGALFFRIYGRGETYIPQDVINLFDSIVTPYTETYSHPVAIVNNSLVEAGELNVTVEFEVYTVVLETNSTLKLGGYKQGASRVIKAYRVRIKAQVKKGRTSTGVKRVQKSDKLDSIRGLTFQVEREVKKRLKAVKENKLSKGNDEGEKGSSEEISVEELGKGLDNVIETFVTRADRFSITESEMKQLVNTYFTSMKRNLENGFKTLIAKVFPKGSILYNIVFGISKGVINSYLGSSWTLAKWAVSNKMFSKAASLVLRAVEKQVSMSKAILTLLVFKILSGLKTVLTWLGKGIDWFIDTMVEILGIPEDVADLVKRFYHGWLDTSLTVLDSGVAFLKDEADKALKVLSEGIGEIFKPIYNMLQKGIQVTSTLFRDAMTIFYELMANPIFSYMLMQGIGGKEIDGKIASRVMPIDNYDFISALSPIHYKWPIERLEEMPEVKNFVKKIYNLNKDDRRAFYVAPSSFLVPVLADWYLDIMGLTGVKGSMFETFYTHYNLVEIVDKGEKSRILWLEDYQFGYWNDKLYATLRSNKLAEIVEWKGASLWNIIGYVKIKGEMKAVPMVLLCFDEVKEDSKDLVKRIIDTFKDPREMILDTFVVEKGKAMLFVLNPEYAIKNEGKYDREVRYMISDLTSIRKKPSIEFKDNFINKLDYGDDVKVMVDAFTKMLKSSVREIKGKYNRYAVLRSAGDYEIAVKDSLYKVFIGFDAIRAGEKNYRSLYLYNLNNEHYQKRLKEIFGYPIIVEVGEKYMGKWKDKIEEDGKKINAKIWKWQGKYNGGESIVRNGALLSLAHFIYQIDLIGTDINNVKLKLYIPGTGDITEVHSIELLNLFEKLKSSNWYRELTEREKKILIGIMGLKEGKPLKSVGSLPRLSWNDINPLDLSELLWARDPANEEIKVVLNDETGVIKNLNDGNIANLKGLICKSASTKVDLVAYAGKEGFKLDKGLRGGYYNRVKNSWKIYAWKIRYMKALIDAKIKEADIKGDKKLKNDLESLGGKLEEAEKAFRIFTEEASSDKAVESSEKLGALKTAMKAYILTKFVLAAMIAGFLVQYRIIAMAPNFFAKVANNRWLQLILGAAMTIFFIIATNIDFDWMKGIISRIRSLKLSTGLRGVAAEVNRIASSIGRSAAGGQEQALMILGSFIAGMGIVLKSIGVEFYFQDEINAMIGEALSEVNSLAGWFWKNVMMFRLPYVEWTPFDVLLSVALEGPVATLSEVIIGTVIMKVLAPAIDNLLTFFLVKLLS